MSIKKHVRQIHTQADLIDLYIVEPEKDKDNFKFPYVLVVPKEMSDGAKLIVESNNKERNFSNAPLDYRYHKDRDFLIDQAVYSIIGNYNSPSRLDHIEKTGAPFLMPILPTLKSGNPYFQQLSTECFDSSLNGTDFERIDLQVIKMIDDAKNFIYDKEHKTIQDKIFLNGYSSSAVFAQRFSLLHPELIDTLLIGGAASTVFLPPDIKGSSSLDYPLGTKDFKELTGKEFNLDDYKKIRFQMYVSEFEDIDKSQSRTTSIGLKAPIHDMTYLDRSVPTEVGSKYRKLYRPNLWTRFKKAVSSYENNGYDINIDIHPRTVHSNSFINPTEFTAIYDGGSLPKSSKDISRFSFSKFLNFLSIAKTHLRNKSNYQKLLSAPSLSDKEKQTQKEIDELLNSIDIRELTLDISSRISSSKVHSQIETLDNYIREKASSIPRTSDIYDCPSKISLSRKDCESLAQKLFSDLGLQYLEHFNKILEGNQTINDNQHVSSFIYPYSPYLKYYHTKYDQAPNGEYFFEEAPMVKYHETPEEINTSIYIPMTGTLRDLYSLVHETMHTMDCKNGNNSARVLLTEVTAQCGERLVDSFLRSLTPEELDNYHIDPSLLENEINDRQLATTLSRYHTLNTFNNRNESNQSALETLRYILAQIYQSEFVKQSYSEQQQTLKDFIDAINENDFYSATNTLGFNILDDSYQDRKKAIDTSVRFFEKTIPESLSNNHLNSPFLKDRLDQVPKQPNKDTSPSLTNLPNNASSTSKIDSLSSNPTSKDNSDMEK